MGRETTDWELIYTGWSPDEQPLREALTALGNGYLVTRGALEEVRAGGPHYPGTYLAGGYDRLETEIAGRVVESEDLVNWPNWLPLTFRPAGGDWLSPGAVELLRWEQRLDMRRGLLLREMRFRDGAGRETSLRSRRLVHVADPHLAAIEWRLTPHDWSGEVEILTGLDGTVVNAGVPRYREYASQHLQAPETGYDGDDTIHLSVRTVQSRIAMTQAARTRAYQGEAQAPTRRELRQEEGRIAQLLVVPCEQGKELRVEKVVAVHTSRDFAQADARTAARRGARRAGSFAELLRTHERRWRHLWDAADIEVHGAGNSTQSILRLHVFHLLQTTSHNTIDRDVGVPARGWHGEAYRGHVFWDELFIFPFLTLRIPEVTRSLLMYRYRRLPEARHMAAEEGYAGAMFPWQSGSDGREESQVVHLNPRSGRWVPDVSNRQRHVGSAIAYNVWRYHQATGDMEFLSYYGAEILVEVARFWASIATYDAERRRYDIAGVMGPDEFHTAYPDAGEPGLKNNAYTNVMAAWVLRTAGTALGMLDEERRRELRETLEIEDEELARWDEVGRRLTVPFHGDGIISQFAGYEDLAEFDWEGYRRRYGDIHRLDRILEAEGDDVNRYKASKQADVLMLFHLFSAAELEELFAHLGYPFEVETIFRTIDYYMRRTSHGSTLSRIVHAWVLARADREGSWRFFQEALHSDVEDVQGGTTPEGIHLGAMAGTVDLVQRCHTGLEVHDEVLWLDPVLPAEVDRVRLRIRYRGHWLSVDATHDLLRVSFDHGWSPAVRVGFAGEAFEMAEGETREFPLSGR